MQAGSLEPMFLASSFHGRLSPTVVLPNGGLGGQLTKDSLGHLCLPSLVRVCFQLET